MNRFIKLKNILAESSDDHQGNEYTSNENIMGHKLKMNFKQATHHPVTGNAYPSNEAHYSYDLDEGNHGLSHPHFQNIHNIANANVHNFIANYRPNSLHTKTTGLENHGIAVARHGVISKSTRYKSSNTKMGDATDVNSGTTHHFLTK